MESLVEKLARAGYESSAWKHKQPWERNPWAQEAWRRCARDMLLNSGLATEIAELQSSLEKARDDWREIKREVAPTGMVQKPVPAPLAIGRM